MLVKLGFPIWFFAHDRRGIFQEWRTTFAPILINFSRNVVNVQ